MSTLSMAFTDPLLGKIGRTVALSGKQSAGICWVGEGEDADEAFHWHGFVRIRRLRRFRTRPRCPVARRESVCAARYKGYATRIRPGGYYLTPTQFSHHLSLSLSLFSREARQGGDERRETPRVMIRKRGAPVGPASSMVRCVQTRNCSGGNKPPCCRGVYSGSSYRPLRTRIGGARLIFKGFLAS